MIKQKKSCRTPTRSQKKEIKMKFPKSTQKDKIISPENIDMSGDFDQQLDSILMEIQLEKSDERALTTLYNDLENVFQQMWPGNNMYGRPFHQIDRQFVKLPVYLVESCKVIPFGSITTGLGMTTSDVDCFVNVPENLRDPSCNYVNKAKKALEKYRKKFTEVFAISRANTPIVKFFHIPTETRCDVTFKTPLGMRNSKLVAFLLHTDSKLIPMAMIIKYWAKVHDVSGNGKLTNYALTLLILFYLQQAPLSILPSVEWLQRDRANDVIVDDWNTGFTQDHNSLPSPESSNSFAISKLLGGFFQYFSTFNFEEMVVCPLLGYPVKRKLFEDLNHLPKELDRYVKNVQFGVTKPLELNNSMCIQDPFELCRNVASAITSRTAVEISTYLKFAAATYDKEKHNNCQNFLRIILLQKPIILRAHDKMHPEYRTVISPPAIKKQIIFVVIYIFFMCWFTNYTPVKK